MESAVSVCSFALPRAPSATDTRAIVAASGASTTLTKSKGPSVAHWWRTFAPSSSASRLTSRSRSGFDCSVCRPWSVSVDSIRYSGIAAPFRWDERSYSEPCRLVVVEQGAAEEEDRREDEHRQPGGDVDPLAAPRAQQDEEHPG